MLRKLVLVCVVLGSVGALQAVEFTGTQVAERTEKVLKSIPWASSLAEAKERAQKENKLVFWLQLVGNLDGGL